MLLKKTMLSAFLLLSLYSGITAQDAAVSEILKAKDDTLKAGNLIRYIKQYLDADPEKAAYANAQLIRLSKTLNEPYYIGMGWFYKGYRHSQKMENAKAMEGFEQALQYLSKTNQLERIAVCHLNLSVEADKIGNATLKMNHLTEAIRLLEGTVYKNRLNNAYNQMGTMLFSVEDYEKAAFYYRKVMQSAREIKDTTSLVAALYGMSAYTTNRNNFDASYKYIKEAQDLARAQQNKNNQFIANAGLIDLYRKWKKPAETIQYARELLQAASQANNLQFALYATIGLADGYALTNDHQNTIAYLNKALEISESKGLIRQSTIIYKVLSETYSKQNNPAKALTFYQKYIHYKDSTSNQDIKRAAAEMEIKYQAAQKDLQLHKSRNYMYITIAGLVVALSAAAFFFLRFRNKKQAHQRELKSLQQQKEIQLMQATMQGEERERSRIARDLHDGVAGMLAAVKMHFSSIPSEAEMLMQTEGYRQGIRLLDEAAGELRKTSHNLMPEILLQHGLDEALRRYCNSLNNSKTISIQYDSWGDIDRFSDAFELSVYRIVQELINNIVKHSKSTQAIVQLTQQNDLLCISIEDNGIGFNTDKMQTEGIGLVSLRSRVRAMNGKIELNASEKNGVTAYLEFEISELIRK
ncbi:MAG TPA: ATP-binding protein [Sediminibacterium sp.]|nr:ATP-binding protein [Sediminibacterium sp.]